MSAATKDGQAPEPAVLSPGRPKKKAAAAAPWAVLAALLVIALGVVGIRDALVASGVLDGELWTRSTANAIDGAKPAVWFIPVGIVMALVGLWLVLAALKPRKSTEVELSTSAAVSTRPGDIARLTRAAADDVDGVTAASASASRRKVTVTVTTTTKDDADVRAAVTDTVAARLAPLESPPRLKVRTKYAGGAS